MCCKGETESIQSELEEPPEPPTKVDSLSEILSECEQVTVEDMMNEDFECLIRVGRSLLGSLPNLKDIAIAQHLLNQCVDMHENPDCVVKKNTNQYLKFLLQLISWSVDYPPPLCKGMYDGAKSEKQMWLEREVWYMAVKNLGGKRVLVYMAHADESNDEWIDGGLAVYMNHIENNL